MFVNTDFEDGFIAHVFLKGPFLIFCLYQFISVTNIMCSNKNSLNTQFALHLSFGFNCLMFLERFGQLATKHPGAIGALFEDNGINKILDDGFKSCCSKVNGARYCDLFYDVNPPDDCHNWSVDDEGIFKRALKRVKRYLGYY